MSLLIKNLPWDSDFFNFSVARFDCDKVDNQSINCAIAECIKSGIKLIYVFVQPNDVESIATLQSVDIRLIDHKVTYAMALNSSMARFKSNKHIISATKFNEQLEALALQSGEFSRFRLDIKLPAYSFEKLYHQWLINSLNGLIASSVLVFRDDYGKETGLLTLGEKNARADIGLLAVDALHRGRKIGQQLIQEAQRIAVHKGYNEMQVVTQNDNLLACEFYKRCGFECVHQEYIYHLWLS